MDDLKKYKVKSPIMHNGRVLVAGETAMLNEAQALHFYKCLDLDEEKSARREAEDGIPRLTTEAKSKTR